MLTAQAYPLMLLDIKMPGMDGVEVLKRAKEMRPEIQVVMMTAYATVETAVEAMKIGAHDYLLETLRPRSHGANGGADLRTTRTHRRTTAGSGRHHPQRWIFLL